MSLKNLCGLLLLMLIFTLVPMGGYADCLLCTCDVSSDPISFGDYDPLAGADNTSTGEVSVVCSTLSIVAIFASYDITLSTGLSGSYAPRTMEDGASHTINYNIYTSADHSTVWGNGTGGTGIVSDSYQLINLFPQTRHYTTYGMIPALQTTVPIGDYSDEITVTVTY